MNKYVSKDVVATAINAWREFKNVPNACQRDYIYYGINKTNTPGSLNRNIREKLSDLELVLLHLEESQMPTVIKDYKT